MTTATKPKPQTKPAPKAKAANRTTTPDRTTPAAILERVQATVDGFGWSTVKELSQEAAEVILRDLTVNRQHQALSSEYWRAVVLPKSILPAFRSVVDASALTRVLCETVQAEGLWGSLARHGATDDEIAEQLCDWLPMTASSEAGTVYAETDNPENIRIWFGRKAGQMPALDGKDTIKAVRKLFGIGAPGSVDPDAIEVARLQTCRVCGCTDDDCQQCIEATGQPCRWVEPDLCSRCVPTVVAAAASGEIWDGSKLLPKRETKPAKRETKAAKTETPAGIQQTVQLSEIRVCESNHRKEIDPVELKQLTDSIREIGVLQPLLLRPLTPVEGRMKVINHTHQYEIVAGERRFRAARDAGLKEVPAIIQELGPKAAAVAMFEENDNRVNLNPIERAAAIQQMMLDESLTQADAAKRLKCSQGQISNELRMLKLPEPIAKHIRSGVIAPTLIRPLLRWCHQPAVMDHVGAEIPQSASDQSLELSELSDMIDDAFRLHSRSMRQNSATGRMWQKPKATERYFKDVSKADLKTLQVENSPIGGDATFNIDLFDQLNKEPLAKAIEAWKKQTAADKQHLPARGKAAKPEQVYFPNRHTVSDLIDSQLTESFLQHMKLCRDKAAVSRVVQCMMLMEDYGVAVADQLRGKRQWSADDCWLFDVLDGTPKEIEVQLRSALIQAIEDDSCRPSLPQIHAAAKVLKADLVGIWKPTAELFQALNDHGLATCRDLIELPYEAGPADTHWRKDLIGELVERWPAELIPEFLREFFGLPKLAAKKAKKGRAA